MTIGEKRIVKLLGETSETAKFLIAVNSVYKGFNQIPNELKNQVSNALSFTGESMGKTCRIIDKNDTKLKPGRFKVVFYK